MRKFFFTLHCKMEVIMCKLKKVIHFIENGGNVFHEASRGEYRQESKNVSQFKKELFSGTSSNATDRTNLINDRKAVSKDVQTAWRKLKFSNG
ncbi:hypothetical protein [Leyella lascolaii]|uniref:Uncharacterized protein n=1 Tax=Leyella lascolaii TaxID=1776379 RepID=A0AAW7JKV3_9BACT|nr:hypothetical protein [Leyella lascolaii]MDN0023363.1 hypothetical protein [Leyella lascolaii]MDN0024726.1 hypothetical protein [Leyella lascolaii]